MQSLWLDQKSTLGNSLRWKRIRGHHKIVWELKITSSILELLGHRLVSIHFHLYIHKWIIVKPSFFCITHTKNSCLQWKLTFSHAKVEKKLKIITVAMLSTYLGVSTYFLFHGMQKNINQGKTRGCHVADWRFPKTRNKYQKSHGNDPLHRITFFRSQPVRYICQTDRGHYA